MGLPFGDWTKASCYPMIEGTHYRVPSCSQHERTVGVGKLEPAREWQGMGQAYHAALWLHSTRAGHSRPKKPSPLVPAAAPPQATARSERWHHDTACNVHQFGRELDATIDGIAGTHPLEHRGGQQMFLSNGLRGPIIPLQNIRLPQPRSAQQRGAKHYNGPPF